jgi:hypothetical protein
MCHNAAKGIPILSRSYPSSWEFIELAAMGNVIAEFKRR